MLQTLLVCGVNVSTLITWHSQKAQRELTRFMTFQVNHRKKEVFLYKYPCRQASHQRLKAQGHNAALYPCFAFSCSLSLYCGLHYQHSHYMNYN